MSQKSHMGRLVWRMGTAFLLLGLVLAPKADALTAVLRPGGEGVCKPFALQQELRVYKDASLFEESIQEVLEDMESPRRHDNTLLTTLRGQVSLQILGKPHPIASGLAGMYGLKPEFDEKGEIQLPKIVPVQVCSTGAFGFVVEKELQKALQEDTSKRVGLPPSTYPNPVPDFKR